MKGLCLKEQYAKFRGQGPTRSEVIKITIFQLVKKYSSLQEKKNVTKLENHLQWNIVVSISWTVKVSSFILP